MTEEGKVFDLFQNRRFRARLFDRIEHVSLAQMIRGQLDVNVQLTSQPPEGWFEELACTAVVDRKTIADHVQISKAVTEDPDFALLMTDKSNAFAKEGHLPAGTVITLTDTVTGQGRSFRTKYGNAA